MLSPLPVDRRFDVQSGEEKPRRPTLLVVDDELGPRQSLWVVFKDEYNVLLAESGTQAIELVRQHTVDAAVLDIRMSGMTGIELLERLKAVDPYIEAIILTAYETIDTARQALRFGACDYLNKPFDVTTMRAAVANAMERRFLSEEIRHNNEKLIGLQSELQNQKLQEEIARSRGEIYASIIHDINGPLTIISGFIQIISQKIGGARRIEGDDVELIKDRLKRMTRQVSNCIDISQRYLSFMRQTATENTRVRINQIFEDLGELLKVHPSSQDQELDIQGLSEDVFVQINGTDLIQILLNLSINALQSTPEPHRVEIRARKLTFPVDVAQLAPPGPNDLWINHQNFRNVPPLLRITVKDTGPGIPSGLMARIFETYFTTKAPGKGTGLGLSIVERLVKEARGLLHLHSEEGAGTSFDIYLPAWSAPPR